MALSHPQTYAHRSALTAACVSDKGTCTDPQDIFHSSRSPFRLHHELVPRCCWVPPVIPPLMLRGVRTVVMWRQHRVIRFATANPLSQINQFAIRKWSSKCCTEEKQVVVRRDKHYLWLNSRLRGGAAQCQWFSLRAKCREWSYNLILTVNAHDAPSHDAQLCGFFCFCGRFWRAFLKCTNHHRLNRNVCICSLHWNPWEIRLDRTSLPGLWTDWVRGSTHLDAGWQMRILTLGVD